jgi:hypothetical protein
MQKCQAQHQYLSTIAIKTFVVTLPTACIQQALQYADFEEAQEEAIPCHSRRGMKCESIMTHS